MQDGYPFEAAGRDNGVMYWGQFGKVKVSVGAFDGRSATGEDDVLCAGRVQVDFWDAEDGYYLNGTYYGEKNLLAIGGAAQAQDGDVAAERRLPAREEARRAAARSPSRAEYATYDGLGGYDADYSKSSGALRARRLSVPASGTSTRASSQVLGKFATATLRGGHHRADYDQDTTEINLNYLIKEFNARVMFFFEQHHVLGRPTGLRRQSVSACKSRCKRCRRPSIDFIPKEQSL